MALSGPSGLAIAKTIYLTALPRFDELCKPTRRSSRSTASSCRRPPRSRLDRRRLRPPLRHDPSCSDYDLHLRQLVHVAFRVAAEMGAEWRAALDDRRGDRRALRDRQPLRPPHQAAVPGQLTRSSTSACLVGTDVRHSDDGLSPEVESAIPGDAGAGIDGGRPGAELVTVERSERRSGGAAADARAGRGQLGIGFVETATIERYRCLLFTHKLSLYSFWALAVRKPDLVAFEELFRHHALAMLENDGFTNVEIARLLPAMGHRFANTSTSAGELRQRSVTRYLNARKLTAPHSLVVACVNREFALRASWRRVLVSEMSSPSAIVAGWSVHRGDGCVSRPIPFAQRC